MSDPTPAPVVAQTFWQRLAHQAEITARSGSTYVVIAIGGLVGIYNGMDGTQQAAFLAAFPFLKGWGSVVTAVMVFLGTRIKPSTALSSQTQALIDEIARLKMNEYRRVHGAPEIPPPVNPVPLPAAVLPAPPVSAPTPAPAPADPSINAEVAAAEKLIASLRAMRASRPAPDTIIQPDPVVPVDVVLPSTETARAFALIKHLAPDLSDAVVAKAINQFSSMLPQAEPATPATTPSAQKA